MSSEPVRSDVGGGRVHGARVRIGTAGWSYPDWHGIVYPARVQRAFQPLAWLARWFDTVEVNSSFYHIPHARHTAAWVRQTPADFRFCFKLTRLFTHDRPAQLNLDAVEGFHEALRPVREAARLGPLLMQFPWSLRFTPQAAEYVLRLADAFAEFARSVEVRHASWLTPEGLDVLRRAGGFCNIDQPRLADCIGATSHVWSPTAYVRLHGRNAANWFAPNRASFERYNYLYSPAELDDWVQRIVEMSNEAEEVYVITNNHYRGQAVVNALELRHALFGERRQVPQALIDQYPSLKPFCTAEGGESLFEERE